MANVSEAWDAYSAEYQGLAKLPTDSAHYGPDLPLESELRLLGDLKGKRVLELGCGAAQCSIAFAKQGAVAIGIDVSPEQLSHARSLCDAEEVRVELRQGDVADLAFLRADSIDLAFSSGTFEYVEDLNRVFRNVHRVLKVGAPFVFSMPHPAYSMFDFDERPDPGVVRSYFDRAPIDFERAGKKFTVYPRSFAELYMGLSRASYRVDLVLEPEPVAAAPRSAFWNDALALVPRTLIVRARKEGN